MRGRPDTLIALGGGCERQPRPRSSREIFESWRGEFERARRVPGRRPVVERTREIDAWVGARA